MVTQALSAVSYTHLSLLAIAGCTGGHALDNPIKTCKAVTVVLAGDRAVVWHAEKQTEQPGVQLQVTLDFSLVGQAQGEVSQAVCNYGLSSQDMDYRNAMGEYANTPTTMPVSYTHLDVYKRQPLTLVKMLHVVVHRCGNDRLMPVCWFRIHYP